MAIINKPDTSAGEEPTVDRGINVASVEISLGITQNIKNIITMLHIYFTLGHMCTELHLYKTERLVYCCLHHYSKDLESA